MNFEYVADSSPLMDQSLVRLQCRRTRRVRGCGQATRRATAKKQASVSFARRHAVSFKSAASVKTQLGLWAKYNDALCQPLSAAVRWIPCKDDAAKPVKPLILSLLYFILLCKNLKSIRVSLCDSNGRLYHWTLSLLHACGWIAK